MLLETSAFPETKCLSDSATEARTAHHVAVPWAAGIPVVPLLWGCSSGPSQIPPSSSPHPSPTRYLAGPDLILQTQLLCSTRNLHVTDCWRSPLPELQGRWGQWRDGKVLDAKEPHSQQRGAQESCWAHTPEIKLFFCKDEAMLNYLEGRTGGPCLMKGTAGPPQGGRGTHRFEGSDFSQQTLINLVMFFSLTICNSYILHFLSEQKGHLVPIGVTSIYIYRLWP